MEISRQNPKMLGLTDDKPLRRARRIIRLYERGDEDGSDAEYFKLADMLPGGEFDAFHLLVCAVLHDGGAKDWPERVVREVRDHAWQDCCADGIDMIGTMIDSVRFAMDMHDWNRIKEEQ